MQAETVREEMAEVLEASKEVRHASTELETLAGELREHVAFFHIAGTAAAQKKCLEQQQLQTLLGEA